MRVSTATLLEGWRDGRPAYRARDPVRSSPRSYARPVPDLPLFPLGTVLFPGLVLPLHVFEPRYRALVADLLALPEPERRFGVVAIREGREVGVDGVAALYDVGLRGRAAPRRAGRRRELRDGHGRAPTGSPLGAVRHDRAYLVGEVELAAGRGRRRRARRPCWPRPCAGRSRDYLAALAEAGAGAVDRAGELPDDPLVLSHLRRRRPSRLDLAERQALLAEPDGSARLGAELRLLRRESALLRALGAVPSPALTRAAVSPN